MTSICAMRVNTHRERYRPTKILMVTQPKLDTIYGRDEFLLIFSFFFLAWNLNLEFFKKLFMDIYTFNNSHTHTDHHSRICYISISFLFFFVSPYGRLKIGQIFRDMTFYWTISTHWPCSKLNYDFLFLF